eukprot:m.244246 g.244246  ORF g.244246 m.244246 type:complete len:309 (+) comp19469_c0_seq6:243-1169(+)
MDTFDQFSRKTLCCAMNGGGVDPALPPMKRACHGRDYSVGIDVAIFASDQRHAVNSHPVQDSRSIFANMDTTTHSQFGEMTATHPLLCSSLFNTNRNTVLISPVEQRSPDSLVGVQRQLCAPAQLLDAFTSRPTPATKFLLSKAATDRFDMCLSQSGEQHEDPDGLRMMSDESDDFCFDDDVMDETNNTAQERFTFEDTIGQTQSQLYSSMMSDDSDTVLTDDDNSSLHIDDSSSPIDSHVVKVIITEESGMLLTQQQLPDTQQAVYHSPPRRRRQSVFNVAERWGMSLEDAAEIMTNVELANPNTVW